MNMAGAFGLLLPRVLVQFDDAGSQSYPGTVAQHRKCNNGKDDSFLVLFDDGDLRWLIMAELVEAGLATWQEPVSAEDTAIEVLRQLRSLTPAMKDYLAGRGWEWSGDDWTFCKKTASAMAGGGAKKRAAKKRAAPTQAPAPLPGTRIDVWWEGDRLWFPGTVVDFDHEDGQHFVEYDDGDEKWENFDPAPSAEEQPEGDGAGRWRPLPASSALAARAERSKRSKRVNSRGMADSDDNESNVDGESKEEEEELELVGDDDDDDDDEEEEEEEACCCC